MDPIDKKTRQRLYDHEVPPPDFVWPKVEAALRHNRRQPLLWWWTGSLLTVGLLAVVWWWVKPTQSEQPTTGISGSQKTEAIAQNSTNNTENGASEPTSAPVARTGTDVEMTHRSPITQTKKIAASQTTVSNIVPQKNLQAKGSTPPQQPVAASYAALPVVMDVEMGSQTSPVLLENNTATDAVEALNTLQPSDRTQASESTNQPINTRQQNRATMTLPVVLTQNWGWSDISTLQKPTLRVPQHKAATPTNPTRTTRKANTNCYDFESQRAVWMLEAYGGPLVQRRVMTNQASSEFDAYVKQRISTETEGVGFTSGLHVTGTFLQHVRLRTGIRYDQYTSRMQYVDPLSITYEIRSVFNVQTGQTTLDTLGVHFGEERTSVYNRFGFVEVPLELGFEKRKGRFGVNIQAGISANVLFWKRGSVVSPVTGKPAVFTPGPNNEQAVFTKRAGLSAGGSLQGFWHWRRHTRLFIEPAYRRILQPITLPGHPVRQQSTMWSLRVGAAHIF
jgi:hypothetical protein